MVELYKENDLVGIDDFNKYNSILCRMDCEKDLYSEVIKKSKYQLKDYFTDKELRLILLYCSNEIVYMINLLKRVDVVVFYVVEGIKAKGEEYINKSVSIRKLKAEDGVSVYSKEFNIKIMRNSKMDYEVVLERINNDCVYSELRAEYRKMPYNLTSKSITLAESDECTLLKLGDSKLGIVDCGENVKYYLYNNKDRLVSMA